MKKSIIIAALLMASATVMFGPEIIKMGWQDDTSGAMAEAQKQQDEAYQLYSQLLDSFTKTKSGAEEYPEYYSGAYIDDNNRLVVLIKEGEDTEIEHIAPLANNKSYTAEVRKYSLNQLNSANQKILEYVDNYENGSPDQRMLIEKIKGISVSERDNKIYINVDGTLSDHEKTILLNQVADSGMIEFVDEPKMVEG